MPDRYSAQGVESQFEPGSRGRVLRNLQEIKSVREMSWIESDSLLEATQHMIDVTQTDQCFSADDIRNMHKTWLGDIYEWAGEYRQVNIAKGDFLFAAAAQIPR